LAAEAPSRAVEQQAASAKAPENSLRFIMNVSPVGSLSAARRILPSWCALKP
jgi:hypothetical protein